MTSTEANRQALAAEFERLKERLGATTADAAKPRRRKSKDPPALARLSRIFSLTPFEREILLLAAGVEMDSALAAHCPRVTFGLALSVLREPHWSALTPMRPLRRYRMIDVERNHGLTSASLRIDERILHFLADINLPDPRIEPFVKPVAPSGLIAEEHRTVAARAALARHHLVQLCGDDPQGQEDVAALAASEAGLQLFAAHADELPGLGPDLDQFMLLWEREALLLPAALLIHCGVQGLTPSTHRLAERLPGTLLLAVREPVRCNRPMLRFDVDKPRPVEQKRLWQAALGEAAPSLNGTVDTLSEQFRLSARAIRSAAAAEGLADPHELWNVCRSLARPRLENLAQRLTVHVGWDDLVLPAPQLESLRCLAAQVRHRMKVYETWGFSAKTRAGLGISALFTGESGTGKTLAAGVLAHELALDLYRIDLSAVVSKYIGETEKNLKQVFDAAEEGGAILLFDEADALFGKRGDVRDSHDRYANIEVGYLLQRMESYQGLAILTTNIKSALDKAFQRRLRFTVHFPFPDAAQRQAIWSRAFPPGTPTRDLDAARLAQLKVAGGNIRNIALNAAFLAAADNSAVGMVHLLAAAALESHKIERPISDMETKGWIAKSA